MRILSPESPRWKADKERQACQFCGVKFTLLIRRHHCRCCGDVQTTDIFCSYCTSHTVKANNGTEHRNRTVGFFRYKREIFLLPWDPLCFLLQHNIQLEQHRNFSSFSSSIDVTLISFKLEQQQSFIGLSSFSNLLIFNAHLFNSKLSTKSLLGK
ncbi:Zinc finger FYVE domain-containing protein 9 [Balamuthia mandrillaris]